MASLLLARIGEYCINIQYILPCPAQYCVLAVCNSACWRFVTAKEIAKRRAHELKNDGQNTLPIKGRGAVSNAASRFLPLHSVPVDDGWRVQLPHDEAEPALETVALPDRTRQIITRNQSPDVPFDRSINPYKGCEHGCVYCFARPTHTYLDLSAGLDFESRLFYKTNVRELLTDALCKAGYEPAPIALGTNTDPYQPLERDLRITRQVLEVLLEANHPVTLVTKSRGVLRDLDIWRALAEKGLAKVAVSVTTLDDELKRRLEPRAASARARLQTISALADAGVPVAVMAAPVIPFINDHELEDILSAAQSAGASAAGYIFLRLPGEVAALFEEWLDAHYPLKKARVLAALRGARGGRLYDSKWGQRMRGTGAVADIIAHRFQAALKKLDLLRAEENQLRTDLFRPPHRQQSLF